MRPPGSEGGPPPLRERFYAALRSEFCYQCLAPFFVGAISSPLGVEYAEWPPSPRLGGRTRHRLYFGVDDAAGIIGRPSPFQGIILTALLRGEHAVHALAAVDASAEADVIINVVVAGGDALTAFSLSPGRCCRHLFLAAS